MGWPDVSTADAYSALDRDAPSLREAAAQLAGRLGADADSLHRFSDGSLPVFSVSVSGGDSGRQRRAVLKLFPPPFVDEWSVEQAVLADLEAAADVPSPALRASGLTDGWGYVLMDFLPGVSAAAAWPSIPRAAQEGLVQQVGCAVAALHRVAPSPRLRAALAGDRLRFGDFINQQRAAALSRHRSHGVAEEWLEQIPGFLDGVDLPGAGTALLHTEVMREHLRVQCIDGSWRLTGLFDFEPARVGAPEYDFASIGLFVSAGDRSLFSAFLRGFGVSAHRGAALSQQVLAYAILHRYSRLPWYFERVPPPPECKTLPELAEAWFGFDR